MVSGYACASENTHACCHKRNTTSGTVPTRNSALADSVVAEEAPASTMSGCPMAINASAVNAKSQTQIHKALQTLSEQPLPFERLPDQVAQFSSTLELSDRDLTYLRCCVFLI
jgi:hypothetical protein